LQQHERSLVLAACRADRQRWERQPQGGRPDSSMISPSAGPC